MKSVFLIISFLFIGILTAFAQKSKAQLEKEKSDNIRKIKETEKIIQETKSQKEATLGQLSAIKQQIQARQSLINSISHEISLMDGEIGELKDLIDALESDLVALKTEYAAMIYAASKYQNSFDKLTFIFSADSYHQLIRRVKYFKQYAAVRQIQVEQIEKLANYLKSQKQQLDVKKKEKKQLLASKTIETDNLNNLLAEQDQVVKELSFKETKLKKELDSRRKAVGRLDNLIADLVKRELEKAKKEAERAAAASAKAANAPKANAPSMKMTPEAELVSSSFAANMKKLGWPVARGEISHHFGKQPHPVLKDVYVDNLGIDIITLKGEPVRAVFQGKVVTVASVPGMSHVVMIQHGEYFTVYAKLKSVNVKTGQEVNAKDIIGEVYTDKDDVSELQFQIWKSHVKLDPEKWLFRK